MERNKTIMKLCYLQTTFYIVFLTALITRHRRGISQKTFAFLIILSLVGCAVSLTLGDYLRNMIRSSGFDVAGVHDKKSLEKKLQQLQNADDTLNVGVMMFDLNNLKKINDTYGHEQGDVFIQTFASYLTRILTEDSFLARFGGDEFVIVQNHATWSQLEQMNIQLQSMLDVYNQTADHPISYAVGYDISCKNHYYLIMDLLQIADQKMYQDKRYKKEQMAKKPQEFCRNRLAESISTESLKEKLFTILNNSNGEKKYAFLMTDVSNFHLINDYWGYETGTNILNFILKKMELFPQTLFVNRYHSDIFVAVIDITGAEHTAVKKQIIESNKQTTKEVLSAYPVNYLSLNTGIYYLENTEIPGEEIISHSNIVRIKAKISFAVCANIQKKLPLLSRNVQTLFTPLRKHLGRKNFRFISNQKSAEGSRKLPVQKYLSVGREQMETCGFQIVFFLFWKKPGRLKLWIIMFMKQHFNGWQTDGKKGLSCCLCP